MLDFLLKQYYRIPEVKFRSPFIFRKKDDREVQWFHERRKFGFDERELWNLSANFGEMILKDLKDVDSQIVSKEQFIEWYNKESSYDILKWFYKRAIVYQEYKCPTFYLDKKNQYKLLPKIEQEKIVENIIFILSKRILNNRIDIGDAE